MKCLGLAAAALMMTISASASTIVETCGTFTNTTPTTAQSSTITCGTFASTGASGTVTAEYLVYDGEYSGGSTTVVETTSFSFSGASLANGADVVTTSGGASPTTHSSADTATFNAVNGSINAGFYDNVITGIGNSITVNYTNQVTTGTATSDTGFVQEVFTYTPTAPEPASLALLGTGLVALGFVRRKRVQK